MFVKVIWHGIINYLQLQFLDGLVFELFANVAVVRKCFILFIYPSSSFAASLTLGTALVAICSSTRVSTGEYLELGVSVGISKKKFQVKKETFRKWIKSLFVWLNYQAVQGPAIVESPLDGPCKRYVQALNKNEELLNKFNFISVCYEKEQSTRVCHLRRLTIHCSGSVYSLLLADSARPAIVLIKPDKSYGDSWTNDSHHSFNLSAYLRSSIYYVFECVYCIRPICCVLIIDDLIILIVFNN